MLAAGIVLSFVVVVVIFLTLGVAGLNTLTTLSDPASVDIHALFALGAALMIVFVVAFIGTGVIAMAFWFAPALVALDHEEPSPRCARASSRRCATSTRWSSTG
jgi:hypothetical protein